MHSACAWQIVLRLLAVTAALSSHSGSLVLLAHWPIKSFGLNRGTAIMLAKQYQVYLLKSWNQFGGYSEILK